MLRLLLCIVVATAAGCPAPAQPAGSEPPTREMTVSEPAAPPVDAAEPEPAARKWTTREPALTQRPGAVETRLIARAGLGAAFSPDGETVLVIRGRGGVLLDSAGKRRASLPRRHFVLSRFSPDGRYLALMDERERILVIDRAGKRLHDISGARRPRWIDGTTLAFRRGCTAHRLSIGGDEQVIGTAPKPCGKVVESSADGTTWWLAEPGRYRRGVLQTYRALSAYDLVANQRRPLYAGTDNLHIMLPQVAADGSRYCYLDAQFDLFCRTAGSQPMRIVRNARRPITLHESGRWLLFAIGKHTTPDSKVGIVDFEELTITLLPRAGRQWWTFLDGGRRIAGHGGSSSAIVYDLEAAWSAEVGDPGSEWEGLYPDPANPDRFILGRERGGTRDLYWGQATGD